MRTYYRAFASLEAVLFLVPFFNNLSSQAELFRRSGHMMYASFSRCFDNKVYNQTELISRETAQDANHCFFLCTREPSCWAVNFGQVADKPTQLLCDLLPWSIFNESQLVEKPGFSYSRIVTPCDNKPCHNGGLCEPTNEAPYYKCTCSSVHEGDHCEDCIIFTFEHGIADWSKTGTAFDTQPTYGDNPTARNRGQPANQVGDWWIGGYENRSSPSATPGRIQGDAPTGRLTSPEFQIRGRTLSFLIGGGCDVNLVYAELLVEGVSIFKVTGSCSESMGERQWDVSAYVGKKARLRLVDSSSVGWSHINFDHLVNRFCKGNPQ